MPTLNSLSAAICINGCPLQEYHSSIEGDTVTAYIDPQDGAEFSVQLHKTASQPVCADIMLDGIHFYSPVLYDHEIKTTVSGKMVGNNLFRPLMFNKTNPHGVGYNPDNVHDAVGTIRVKISFVRIVGAEEAANLQDLKEDFTLDDQAHALGLSCRSGLGPIREKSSAQWKTVDVQYRHDLPGAEFIFVYRRRGALDILDLFENFMMSSTPQVNTNHYANGVSNIEMRNVGDDMMMT
ncbi:hypothetical protein NEOLI_001383 [Neolecta irregularis DAH-3]|uniref:DUF7918 domain-containing protein n=1 Tax=Neolecta irregularis (strain DAH-3) TaxID=1198029 RepID=A0A1U7LT65_NEOID|nr:hypothetical protein NEOLI_001383 [Neolecta irregularis DAH-3]|eukprot:OLL25866.1 hypothetical protein NEOLI_001383 [Neolecta irregularis DAH-3]